MKNFSEKNKKIIILVVIIISLLGGFFVGIILNNNCAVIAERGSGDNCTEEKLTGKEFLGNLKSEKDQNKKTYSNEYHKFTFELNDPSDELKIDHEHSNSMLMANEAFYSGKGDVSDIKFIQMYTLSLNEISCVPESIAECVKDKYMFFGLSGENIQNNSKLNDNGVEINSFTDGSAEKFVIKNKDDQIFVFFGEDSVIETAMNSFNFIK